MRKILLGAMILVAAVAAVMAPAAPAFAQTDLKIGWVVYTGDWDNDLGAPHNLRHEIAARTGYNVSLDFVHLNDPQGLSQYQMLIISGHYTFSFTDAERAGLRVYLENGGFIFADDCYHAGSGGFDTSFRDEINAMFPPGLFQLPNDHQIFSSFYSFMKNPPTEWYRPPAEWNTPPTEWNSAPLEGVLVNGSVRVVFEEMDYSCGWNTNEAGYPRTSENSFQMATNAAVYALQSPTGTTPPPADPARVDLVLEWGDITFWTTDGLTEVTNPDLTAPVLIRAVVHNLSADGTSAPGTVFFYDAYENVPEVPVNNGANAASLPAIPPGGTDTAEILWTPTLQQEGYHLIRAWVYPDVNESYGYNNNATHFIVRGGPPAAGAMNIDVLSLSIGSGSEYPVAIQVQLSGYVQYRWAAGYLLPVLGGEVTISLGAQTWTTRTLNNGMFYQVITLPATAGSQTLTVAATDATLSGTATVNFTTTSYPPDLVIRSISPTKFVATVAETVHATVENQGTEPLPATTFGSTVEVTGPNGFYWTSSVNTTLTEDLQPKVPVDVAFPGFTPQDPGTYQITVTVDPDGLVTAEPNKSNNVRTQSVLVYPHAVDLRVDNLSKNCTTVTAYVSNQGGLPSSAGTVTFSDDLGWTADQSIPSVPGKGDSTSVSVSYPGTGSRVITAVATSPLPPNPSEDLNPADNTLSATFDFNPQVDFVLTEMRVNNRAWNDTNLVYVSYPNTLRALVQNFGCNDASGQVQFFVGNILVGTTDSFALGGGAGIEVSVPFDFAGYTPATNYLLKAVVVVSWPDTDAMPANDTRIEGLIVAPQPADYSVGSSDIAFGTYPRPPKSNEKFQISATIHNGGPAWARDFQVAFYEEGLIPIGAAQTFHLDPGIAPGGSMIVDAPVLWGYGFSGNHAIIVQVAPLAGIQDDPDDTNNTASRAVLINHPPHAEASLVQTDTTRQGDTASLDANGSNDDLDANTDGWDHNVVSYDWDFDDGSIASGSTANHVYAAGGVYHPTVIVTDNSNEPGLAATLTVSVPFKIDASAGSGGTITPAGTVYVQPGGSQAFTIAADAGKMVDSLLVDGQPVTPISPVTFENVTADHTISVTFKAITYTITPVKGSNGSVTPDIPQTVPQGGSCGFVMSANVGYHVEDVKIDGVSIGVRTDYTFDNVTADHTIEVVFGKDPVASFTASPTRGFKGMSVAFTNASNDATVFSWAFGDGATSTDPAPAHAYTANGIKAVSLTASGSSGQPSDTSTLTRSDYICVGYIFSNEAGTATTAPFTRAYYLGGALYGRAWVAKADVDYTRLSSMTLKVTDRLGVSTPPANLIHEGGGNYAGGLTLTGLAAGNATANITVTDRRGKSFTATEPITLAADPRPAVPTNLTASPGNGQVTLTWDNMHAANPNILGYRIYRGTGGAKTFLAEVGLTTTTVDQDLTNGQTYYYAVTSFTAAEESAYSNEVAATPAAIKHAKVMNLETGYYNKGKWTPATSFSRGTKVVIRCTVIDVEANQPLASATVSLRISGANTTNLTSALSNAGGVAEATWSTSTKNATGSNSAAVTNVVRTGFVWDGTPIAIGITLN